jgi:hypothetical protein
MTKKEINVLRWAAGVGSFIFLFLTIFLSSEWMRAGLWVFPMAMAAAALGWLALSGHPSRFKFGCVTGVCFWLVAFFVLCLTLPGGQLGPLGSTLRALYFSPAALAVGVVVGVLFNAVRTARTPAEKESAKPWRSVEEYEPWRRPDKD